MKTMFALVSMALSLAGTSIDRGCKTWIAAGNSPMRSW